MKFEKENESGYKKVIYSVIGKCERQEEHEDLKPCPHCNRIPVPLIPATEVGHYGFPAWLIFLAIFSLVFTFGINYIGYGLVVK